MFWGLELYEVEEGLASFFLLLAQKPKDCSTYRFFKAKAFNFSLVAKMTAGMTITATLFVHDGVEVKRQQKQHNL